MDLASVTAVSIARNGPPTPLRVAWNNQPVILTDGTRIDLAVGFVLADRLLAEA